MRQINRNHKNLSVFYNHLLKLLKKSKVDGGREVFHTISKSTRGEYEFCSSGWIRHLAKRVITHCFIRG